MVALLLATLLPAGPAGAAIRRTRAFSCRSSNATCWPAAFAFSPNGKRVFYVERFTGQIRVHHLRKNRDRRWFTIPGVATQGEQGVLGIALDPRWPKKRWVYVYYTQDSPLRNRIVRIRKGGGSVRMRRLATIPAAGNHNGGVIHFGPDGMLYAVTGDAADPARSQNRRNPAGKVLRMTKAGKRPKSNPFRRSLAYSFGHRNSFGFAFDPQTDLLWQTENGPQCDDEINLVRRGRNYGWGPGSSCPNTSTEGPNPVRPKHVYNPVIAPTGAAFCDGCRLGKRSEGALFVGSFNDNRVRRLILNAKRRQIAAQRVVHTHARFVLAVEAAPNGRLYFSDDRAVYRLARR